MQEGLQVGVGNEKKLCVQLTICKFKWKWWVGYKSTNYSKKKVIWCICHSKPLFRLQVPYGWFSHVTTKLLPYHQHFSYTLANTQPQLRQFSSSLLQINTILIASFYSLHRYSRVAEMSLNGLATLCNLFSTYEEELSKFIVSIIVRYRILILTTNVLL